MTTPRRHPLRPPNRPVGEPTRGKTAVNRLRRIDLFLALYDPHVIAREDDSYAGAWYVDLGYGFEPVTTLQSALQLRRTNPRLRVLGVEIDPERVAAAKPYEDAATQFRLGGFNLPLGAGERVRVVRAFNVLRQYDESAVADAYAELAAGMLPGALLVEGTSDPYGRVWVANLMRKPYAGAARELCREALVFGTNFRAGFEPALFQPVLPKNLIHRMLPGEPVHAFFDQWKLAARETAAYAARGPKAHFIAAAHRLAERGQDVILRPKFLQLGCLVVRKL